MSTNTYKCYKGHIFDSDPAIWRSKCPECGKYGVLFAGKITEDFVEAFARMFNDEVTSDVVLVAEGQSFFAHKAILAARSVYFKNLLYGGLSETYQDRVELEDAPSETFGILLKYLYTGKVELELENFSTVLSVFFLSHRYQIEKLQTYLEDYFESTVRAENICSLLSLAMHYSLNHLVINCCTFVHKNIELVFASNDFGCLSNEALGLLFAMEGIHSKLSGNALSEALSKWNKAHANEIDALANALASTGLSVKIVDGEVSIFKKNSPAIEIRAERNEVVVPNDSIAEVLNESSLDRTADNNMEVSNSMAHKQSAQIFENLSKENTTDDATDAECFQCWFENCTRNPLPSEQARNVHFHEHIMESIEEKSDLSDCFYEESSNERSYDEDYDYYERSSYADRFYDSDGELGRDYWEDFYRRCND